MTRLFAVSFAAAISIACITVPTANAATLSWELQNVTFDDGGTATGSFGFDADAGTFSAINILTSTNGSLGDSYGFPVGFASATTLDFLEAGAGAVLGSSRLLLSLSSAMTNSGGIIAFALTPFGLEGICSNANCTSVDPLRNALGGSIVSAVPIPAAVWLFGTGILGLIGFTKRKSRAAV